MHQQNFKKNFAWSLGLFSLQTSYFKSLLFIQDMHATFIEHHKVTGKD